MTASKLSLLALCLSLLVSASVSQNWDTFGEYGFGGFGPELAPGARMANYCNLFNKEKHDQGKGCNGQVLKKVYDKDKDINQNESMLRIFRLARRGAFCYKEGAHIVTIRSPCHAMEISCRPYSRSLVDNCWKVTRPPTRRPDTPGPNPPQAPETPRGRGI
ncbi:uncharacterized protein LOC129272329 [Lytechinus pictus]|uniref:uncharacterized protein LOC129272329 n=1 Tax=Lytechinus pictus TaxID=7653 RepID=UPI00240E6117|nr:uncharacterized protein LOC129272329 [Lytechinus pictus]